MTHRDFLWFIPWLLLVVGSVFFALQIGETEEPHYTPTSIRSEFPRAVNLIEYAPCALELSRVARSQDMNCVLDFYGFSEADHVRSGEQIERSFRLLESCTTCRPGRRGYRLEKETFE